MIRRIAGTVVTLLVVAASRGWAQVPVLAPAGTLNGLVQDSATGRPIGYALVVVVGAEQRVFAAESGRFVLSGITPGRLTIRVQQIGYRAMTVGLNVETASTGGTGAPGLVVRLVRRPVVLPEIVVQGDVCSGALALGSTAAEGSILDEAFKNAERILTLEKSYPFRAAFELVSWVRDANDQDLARTLDTVRYDTRGVTGYRQGKVVEGRRAREMANYFTTSDLARDEFRKSHCFWYGGRDSSADGAPGHLIAFAPLAKTRGVDWAGSLLIDSVTMMPTRSEARLVNLNGRATTFTSAECTVLYRQIVPTLVLESEARCKTSRSVEPGRLTFAHWLLINFGFVDRSPVTAPPASQGSPSSR